MSIIKELHDQPEWVRLSLFVLSCATVVSVVLSGWFMSFERSAITSMTDPETAAERLAERERSRGPGPLTAVGKWSSAAAASIGKLVGFDREKGFDSTPRNGHNEERTYLLPLSE
ncbi:MAG TPA: hypothetical protein VD862_04715 [Candidatus Paceibacterota bacterium]|nr:hypothetical protein [Candidatus Paceibacterota bacterium]